MLDPDLVQSLTQASNIKLVTGPSLLQRLIGDG